MVNYMKVSIYVCAFLTLLNLSGCASVNVSDSKLLDKAESATGVVQSNLSVVPGSKSTSGMNLNFKVQDNHSNIYKCYYVKSMWNESDAICTKLSSDDTDSNDNTPCNDLLRAAGKCK
jgi:hypothetical protein